MKQEAMDGAIGFDRQVQTMPRHIQIAKRGTPANTVRVVERYRTHTGDIRGVVVRAVVKPEVAAGGIKGSLIRQPFRLGKTPHNNGPLGIMQIRRAKIRIVLDFTEIWHQLFKCPLIIAHGGPRFIILGHAPQKYLTIDRARAPGDFATRYQ